MIQYTEGSVSFLLRKHAGHKIILNGFEIGSAWRIPGNGQYKFAFELKGFQWRNGELSIGGSTCKHAKRLLDVCPEVDRALKAYHATLPKEVINMQKVLK